jgi:hypothetical protein
MCDMRRRQFITLLGGAAAWPLTVRAQQGERMRRIGVLMGYPENDLEGPAFFAAFREGLQKLGWAEDRNIRFDTPRRQFGELSPSTKTIPKFTPAQPPSTMRFA